MLAALTILALLFGYLTGITDSANVVAPAISVHALPPRRALAMTAIAVSVAPFLFGVAVAHTFGAGVVAPQAVSPAVVSAAVASALIWRIITWRLAIPMSSSHGLVGGLLGAGLAGARYDAIAWASLIKVFAALILSPVIGLLAGYLLARLIYFAGQWATPKINTVFRGGQVLTALTLALSWGANDAQKTIGLLALAVAAATGADFAILPWMVAAAMAATALGALTGGSRLIRTLGGRFYKIRPIHGLAAQASAAGVILSAAFLGGPVSTTQVISTSIMGAGAADRINKVRWQAAIDILWAWLLTIPATGLMSAGLLLILNRWMP